MKPYVLPAVLIAAATALSACSSAATSTTGSSSPAAPATTAAAAAASTTTANPASPVALKEDGSSLLYPFLQDVVAPLHQQFSNITLQPAPGGSGKGISDAISGNVTFGGSDAYLSAGQLAQNQGLMNIPVVVSGQAVNYNLPGVKGLKLTGDILAKIYLGKITKWNDPAIAALNSGLSLPASTIVPIRRVDSSGDTFLFTGLLSATNSQWGGANGPQFGTTVTWPAVSGELTANGNPGMVQTCKATPGCIAYVGVSAEADAQTAGLGEALLQNKDGNFLLPTQATLAAAASAVASSVPSNLAVSLIYQPGANTYPIANFEYIIVKSHQADAATAQAVRTFLDWVMSPTGGSQASLLAKEVFVALPPSVVTKAQAAVAQITG